MFLKVRNSLVIQTWREHLQFLYCSVCILCLEQLCFPSVKQNAKIIWYFVVYQHRNRCVVCCKTKFMIYLLYICITRLHRSVLNLKISEQNHLDFFLYFNTDTQTCKTKSQFFTLFLSNFIIFLSIKLIGKIFDESYILTIKIMQIISAIYFIFWQQSLFTNKDF